MGPQRLPGPSSLLWGPEGGSADTGHRNFVILADLHEQGSPTLEGKGTSQERTSVGQTQCPSSLSRHLQRTWNRGERRAR